MKTDLEALPDGHTFHCDVAIVGAGAAGITLARQLKGKGLRIGLFESGGLDFDADTQALADGINTGDPYYDLVDSRLRFFGGTTAIWGGRCSRYDALDFERRDWVDASGWPLTSTEMEPFYAKAADDFELGEAAASSLSWGDDVGERLGIAAEYFTTRRWRFDDVVERFSPGRSNDVLMADDVEVVLGANVIGIEVNESAERVSHLRLSSMYGRLATVSARRYILACGGIENARLMLASNGVQQNGVGNDGDCVGRYFMEHPHGRVGVLPVRAGFDLWAAFQRRDDAGGKRVAPVLLASEKLQRERGILNSALTFKLQRDAALGLPLQKRLYNQLKHELAPTRRSRSLWHHYRALRKFVQRTVRKPVARFKFARGLTRVNVMVRGEQAPNPDSRVTLDTIQDQFGMPRASLNWRLGEQDKATVRVLAEVLSVELERLGLGPLEACGWLADSSTAWPVDDTVGNHAIAGYHHIGTTRMSESPRTGVVDRNCRVHGYSNLYVAGSSVFPTSGWANPTFTIVALAHRLAEKLIGDLK